MLGNIHFSSMDDGSVKIELSDHTGIVMNVTVVPKNEWEDMRNKIIASVPENFQLTDAFNYLAVMSFLLETH